MIASSKRLGIEPDEITGRHCVTFSRSREVADLLERYDRGELAS